MTIFLYGDEPKRQQAEGLSRYINTGRVNLGRNPQVERASQSELWTNLVRPPTRDLPSSIQGLLHVLHFTLQTVKWVKKEYT